MSQSTHSVPTGWLLGLAVVSSLTTSLSAGNSCAESPKLTVMTWNLEWFYDEEDRDNFSKLGKEKSAPGRPAWAWHRDAVAQSIARSQPTILALQEVENRRVLWYLTQALRRDHRLEYQELCHESGDHFTEQDVGVLFRSPADALSTQQLMQTQNMKDTKNFYNVTKHLLTVFEFPVGNDRERVVVMNIHLRSRAEGEPIRLKQARLVQHWLAPMIAEGVNVIVLGDTNTEETGDQTRAGSDLGVLCGLETATTKDDLYDLHLRLPRPQRQTHLLPGRQFDRILVSKTLLEDTPGRPDLVFESIAVLPDLAIQGQRDEPEVHWERFWKLPADERDLSDHFPVQATFKVQ